MSLNINKLAMEKLIIKTLVVLLSFVSFVSFSNDLNTFGFDDPEKANITLITGSGGSDATIYSNGRNQVVLKAVYENIPTGHTLKHISLKELYTGSDLGAGWEISKVSKGFLSYGSYPLRDKSPVDEGTGVEAFLISTTRDDTIKVCVEMTTMTEIGVEEKVTTCDGTVNLGAVKALSRYFLLNQGVRKIGCRMRCHF
ncbi:hypothetical protein [Vibrio genomosp. F10]|uniref:hypothetical protein n=1 Tax=Vibrio genomosp. F10 TaxID=723171 RepID=UPI00030F18FF|nr:hypothetical protein [Vibrio genomosp. F10]OEF07792.1 hypothetical protein A1QI_16635 [Vibrio genomosp. F10 str. 9ZB36]